MRQLCALACWESNSNLTHAHSRRPCFTNFQVAKKPAHVTPFPSLMLRSLASTHKPFNGTSKQASAVSGALCQNLAARTPTVKPRQAPDNSGSSVIKQGNRGQAPRRGRHKDALDTRVSPLTAFPVTASSRRPPQKPLRLLTCALLIPASRLCSTRHDGEEGMVVGGTEPEMDGGIFFFFFDGRDLLVYQRSTKESSDTIV